MLRLCLRRGFSAKRFVDVSQVNADPNLKKYFEDKLELWTKQFLEQKAESTEVFEEAILEGKRAKLKQLAKTLALLPSEERWLVAEYIQKGSLQNFIDKNTPQGVSQSLSNYDKCRRCSRQLTW